MSKNKDIVQFISVSGVATDIVHKLAQAVAERGGDLDGLRRIISDASLCGELADRLVRRDGASLAAMIAACRFDYPPHPYITEANFPLTGSPVADVADMLTVSQKDLGGQNMTTTQIEVAIDRQGFRPATLAEQLVYAKEKWNGKDWIAALGSSQVFHDGSRCFTYLCGGAGGRGLCLDWGDPAPRWLDVGLCLVVRK
ncbi:MAG: hypothetical protein AAB554_03625 [Patescibacteria group bacterium]